MGHFRIHDLRHAAATLLFAEEASPKEIQALLRHTRLSTTTDIYMDVLKEIPDGTASAMDGVLRSLAASLHK